MTSEVGHLIVSQSYLSPHLKYAEIATSLLIVFPVSLLIIYKCEKHAINMFTFKFLDLFLFPLRNRLKDTT